jgi:hypothetical protein
MYLQTVYTVPYLNLRLSSGDHLVVNYDKTKTAKLSISTIAYLSI